MLGQTAIRAFDIFTDRLPNAFDGLCNLFPVGPDLKIKANRITLKNSISGHGKNKLVEML